MSFVRYQHIERWGNTEVQDIQFGTCHVFPKIDGTNASVWVDDNLNLCCGSRKQEVSVGDDNQGFAAFVQESEPIQQFLLDYPQCTLFGEWLVPYSLKAYRADAWEKFYVFDVMRPSNDKGLDYLTYEEYQPLLESAGLDYIPEMAIIHNGNYEMFLKQLEQNDFLMQDGHKGEGIVIKNYNFQNRFGRQTWAKIVSSEFKKKNQKTMGAPLKEGKQMIEQLIADEFVTLALCQKVKSKIEASQAGWSSRHISRLLQTVYYDVVREECWTFVKKHKNPTIDFKTLQTLVILRIKYLLPEVF